MQLDSKERIVYEESGNEQENGSAQEMLMSNAIAIWNYCWNAEEVCGWVNEFAGYGFDTISFSSNQFVGDMSKHLPLVVDTLRRLDLGATVHGSVALDTRMMETIVGAMGDRLRAFTLDSVMCEDSKGRFHDAARIASALSHLQKLTNGTPVRLAIEDFPLDELALTHFQTELGEIYNHPRTGILIDVGHMHIRRRKTDYFGRLSVRDYFARLPLKIVEVHLHDNDGTKDQHAHFGFGSVPFAEVAAALKETDFEGVCTIEIAPEFHGSTPLESKSKAVESLRLWRGLMEGECGGTNTGSNSRTTAAKHGH